MITNLIDVTNSTPTNPSNPNLLNKEYVNQGGLFTQGVEFEGRYDFHGDYHGSYLLVNYVNQNAFLSNAPLFMFNDPSGSGANETYYLNGLSPFVPRNRINLIGNWQVNRHWNSWINLLYNGSVNRSTTSIQDLPALSNIGAYQLVNYSIRNHEQLAKGFDLSLTIYNLFNSHPTDPATNQSYPGDFTNSGRSFFGHVNYRF